jgi:hypothetical protein
MRAVLALVLLAGVGCAHAPATVRSGHVLVADYSYDGENVRAFVAVEGETVDARPDATAQVEVRRVRECGSGRHVPHIVDATQAATGGTAEGPSRVTVPSGIFWGRYLDANIFVRLGPRCIVAVIGVPVYDAKTGQGTFVEADVELRQR